MLLMLMKDVWSNGQFVGGWFVFIFAFRASEWTVVVPCDRGRNLCFEEWNMEQKKKKWGKKWNKNYVKL